MDMLKGKYVDMTQLIHQVIPSICISFHFPKVIEARALFLLLIRFSVVFYLCYFLKKKSYDLRWQLRWLLGGDGRVLGV